MKTLLLLLFMLICHTAWAQDTLVTEYGELPMREGSYDIHQPHTVPALSGAYRVRRKAPVAAQASPRHIDLISNMPAYLKDFYVQYGKDVAGALQGKKTCLVEPIQDSCLISRASCYGYTLKTYEGEVSFTFANSDEIKTKALAAVTPVVDKQWDEYISFVPYICNCISLDYPEAFWLGSSYNYFNLTNYKISYDPRGNTGKVKYEHTLHFTLKRSIYDIRRDAFPTEADVTDGIARYQTAIDSILFECPIDSDRYEQLRYLNDWLTTHNCYSSILSGYRPDFCYSPLSALEGSVGINGPVCEGYARALKVLGDKLGIPGMLLAGMAQSAPEDDGEDHMWNYVQLENGEWYAIDVTWNDPVVDGATHEALSGHETRNWFLLGSESLVGPDFTFIQSHPVTPGCGHVPQGTLTWNLSSPPQLAAEGVEPREEPGPEPQPEPKFGDIDGDGHITVSDITMLIAIYLDDLEGVITVSDITAVINAYLDDGE